MSRRDREQLSAIEHRIKCGAATVADMKWLKQRPQKDRHRLWEAVKLSRSARTQHKASL